MSLKIEALTKQFGEQKAVDSIDFTVGKGEIVGFLGPNGAGKSTTMKMCVGVLQPTQGRITVCGYNTAVDPLEVKKRVGYLPENNPIHSEMYVKEYLIFICQLYGISKEKIPVVLEQTGLLKEKHKKISQLSKGYKQRVGIAQAILHDPDILFLDEPTSGLDPNQLTDIRNFIRTLGKERTIVISTHILQEVEALCDRVVIIHEGKIIEDAPTARLIHRYQNDASFSITLSEAVEVDFWKDFSLFEAMSPTQDAAQWTCTAKDSEEAKQQLCTYIVGGGLYIREMKEEQKNLEAIFQQLTK